MPPPNLPPTPVHVHGFPHTHEAGEIEGLPSPGGPPEPHTHVRADVTDWPHLHGVADIVGLPEPGEPGPHTHVRADVTDFAHAHPQADVTGLVSALAGKEPEGAAAAAVAAHAAAADPHAGYQLESERAQPSGYASLDGTGKVPGAQIPTHTHAQADVTNLTTDLAGKEPSGVAAGLIATHAAAADPHTGYQRETEKAQVNGYASLDGTGKVPAAQLPAASGSAAPWEGKLHVAAGDGNPTLLSVLFGFQNTVLSVAGPTPTGIGVAVGRLVSFRFKAALAVVNVRFFGVAAVSSAYTMAIYRASDNARLWLLDPCNTSAGAWTSVAASFTLAADTLYYLGLGAKIVGTTAGFRSPASPIATSLGITTLPGNLAQYGPRYAQVALTNGAWPATLPALAAAVFASAGATGTLPLIFLDAA